MFFVISLWLILFKRFSFNNISWGTRITFLIFILGFRPAVGVEKKLTPSAKVKVMAISTSFKMSVLISLNAVCGWKMKKSSFLFVIASADLVWAVVGFPLTMWDEKSATIWNWKINYVILVNHRFSICFDYEQLTFSLIASL